MSEKNRVGGTKRTCSTKNRQAQGREGRGEHRRHGRTVHDDDETGYRLVSL